MNYVVIKAGGSGLRANSVVPKQFVEINGRPIISYTIENYEKSINVDRIVIVCHPEWISYIRDCCAKYNFLKVMDVVAGGKTAMHSIKIGVERVLQECDSDDVIIIQDANRPFTSQKIIKGVIESCKLNGGVICSIPCTEEIVKCVDGTVERLNFKQLYRLQTPEAYTAACLKELFGSANEDELSSFGAIYALRKAKNIDTAFTEGALDNIRITTHDDIMLMQKLVGKVNTEIIR